MIAPVDQVVQTPLSKVDRRVSARQHGSLAIEAGEDLCWVEDVDPGRRELDRQRQPVKPSTQLPYRLLRAVTSQSRSLIEQIHRGRAGVQRPRAIHLLADQPQWLPARCEHPNVRARSQHRFDQASDVGQEVLAVVHDDHRPPLAEVLDRRGPRVAVSTKRSRHRLGQSHGNRRRPGYRGQADEPHAMLRIDRVSQPVLDHKAGLAEAPGTDHAHQPGPLQAVHQLLEFVVPTDERRHPGHQVVTIGGQQPKRRKLGLQAFTDSLEQLDRLVEIADAEEPQRPQGRLGEVPDPLGSVRGNENLAPVTGTHHSGRLMHGVGDVIVRPRVGESGVYSHPHPNHRITGPRL